MWKDLQAVYTVDILSSYVFLYARNMQLLTGELSSLYVWSTNKHLLDL